MLKLVPIRPAEYSAEAGRDAEPKDAEGRTTRYTEFYPKALRKAEQEEAKGNDARVGVALSGGGIRSATLSLGFFQGLARLGLLPLVDYLSTVSGGGYFGGFLGHLFAREDLTKVAPEQEASVPGAPDDPDRRPEVVRKILADSDSPPLRALRENGRYLAPNGSGDLLLAGSVLIRNWVAALLVMLVFALFLLSTISLLRFSLEALAYSWMPDPWVWGPAWLSPWFLAAVVVFVFLAVPPGWAYWLVGDGEQEGRWLNRVAQWAAPVLVLAAGLVWGWFRPVDHDTGRIVLIVLAIVATLAIARYGLAYVAGRREESVSPTARRHLSRSLMRALVVVLVILVIGVVDTIGQSLVLLREDIRTGVISGYAVLAALAVWGRRFAVALVTRFRANERPPVNLNLLVYCVGVLFLVGALGAVAAIPYVIVLGEGAAPAIVTVVAFDPLGPLPLLVLASLALTLVMGRVWPFVNRSSLHAIYEARLRRAYMGASNAERVSSSKGMAVTQPHADDELPFDEYRPEKKGGPIHLINVTVNETVGGRSQVERQDRKGMGMAIGPGGVSVSRRHHARWERVETPSTIERLSSALSRVPSALSRSVSLAMRKGEAAGQGRQATFQVFAHECFPEELGVGQWVAISGAAFSTGLGSRTNLGLSVLAGLFNVRLGYWWSSGLDPKRRTCPTERTGPRKTGAALRKLFPVQSALMDEWLARFPGVEHKEWYLSDGGHFENMGGYELIRRRLPFIVVCDNEMDKDYEFPGLANLVRLARVDFDTEITFLNRAEIFDLVQDVQLRRWIGPLDSLKRGTRQKEPVTDPVTGDPRIETDADLAGLSLAHAALARVEYRDAPPGWLLYVKPTLVGDEPVDVRHYHAQHPDFPHESTGDQFFDEAQWESYRRLGELLATKLFETAGPEWTPWGAMGGGGAGGAGDLNRQLGGL